METINRTGCVKNERVSQRVKEDRNIRHTIKRRKGNWIGHILSMNCLLIHVTEERYEENRRGEKTKKKM